MPKSSDTSRLRRLGADFKTLSVCIQSPGEARPTISESVLKHCSSIRSQLRYINLAGQTSCGERGSVTFYAFRLSQPVELPWSQKSPVRTLNFFKRVLRYLTHQHVSSVAGSSECFFSRGYPSKKIRQRDNCLSIPEAPYAVAKRQPSGQVQAKTIVSLWYFLLHGYSCQPRHPPLRPSRFVDPEDH